MGFNDLREFIERVDDIGDLLAAGAVE